MKGHWAATDAEEVYDPPTNLPVVDDRLVVGWKSPYPCHRVSRSLQPKREEERGDTFREEGLTKCFQRSLASFSLKTWTVWSHPTTQSKQTQTLPLTAEGIRPSYKKPSRVTCFPWPRGPHSRSFHSPRSITTTDAGQDDWFARPNTKFMRRGLRQ